MRHPAENQVLRSGLVEGAEISLDDLADALEQLCSDQTYYEQVLKLTYTRATEPHFSWEAISKQWNELIEIH
ncbi:MAG: glycosyltransferase family 1 protein [Chloroflexi bacterium]|nr:MAG: glycosyltransferase family 1 protein [Chloroflexota bacterium]MBL1195467.1 glycosyltransferase family 1 protein [Chloroflexota bacterium]